MNMNGNWISPRSRASGAAVALFGRASYKKSPPPTRSDPRLANLLLDPYFKEQIQRNQTRWRSVVALAAQAGIAAPAFMSALAYYDGYRSAQLPANLLQAQRDYFGAHTYERIDQPRGVSFHLDWSKPDRPQIKIADSR